MSMDTENTGKIAKENTNREECEGLKKGKKHEELP